MPIERITADDLRDMEHQEGLVLQGCGGEAQEWLDGINDLLTQDGILQNGNRFETVKVFQHDGLTNLLFPFEDIQVDMGKLAMWRLQTHGAFGGTWLSDYVPNRALSELLWQCMREVGAPAWDEADRALAAQFAATLSTGERADNLASTLSATDLPLSHYAGKDLDDGIAPFFYAPKTAEPGSTDVGDVSYCAPTAQCYYAAGALGTGGHTWQMAAQSCSPLGFKGMLAAAAAMALAGARAAADPALLALAREQHAQSCPDGYTCPMPENAVPAYVE